MSAPPFGIRLKCKNCRSRFVVCPCHHYGQQYCSETCLVNGTRRRKCGNQRRYRKSPNGRRTSRRNQNAYRKRLKKKLAERNVSDRTSHEVFDRDRAHLAFLKRLPRASVVDRSVRCIVCGRPISYFDERTGYQRSLDTS